MRRTWRHCVRCPHREDLYNEVVQRPLVLSVRDAAAENALICGCGEHVGF